MADTDKRKYDGNAETEGQGKKRRKVEEGSEESHESAQHASSSFVSAATDFTFPTQSAHKNHDDVDEEGDTMRYAKRIRIVVLLMTRDWQFVLLALGGPSDVHILVISDPQ